MDLAAFWPAFAAEGLLRTAVVTPVAGGAKRTGYVGYVEPDVTSFNGQQSKQYAIEYQAADFPTLAEGDLVTIDAKLKFRVRQAPFVSDIPAEGSDGYFRRVLLTKL